MYRSEDEIANPIRQINDLRVPRASRRKRLKFSVVP